VARADGSSAAWLLRGVAGNSPAASAAPVSGTVRLAHRAEIDARRS
jgi:hypothetical protein